MHTRFSWIATKRDLRNLSVCLSVHRLATICACWTLWESDRCLFDCLQWRSSWSSSCCHCDNGVRKAVRAKELKKKKVCTVKQRAQVLNPAPRWQRRSLPRRTRVWSDCLRVTSSKETDYCWAGGGQEGTPQKAASINPWFSFACNLHEKKT